MNTNDITFQPVRRIAEYRCHYAGQLREQNAFFTFTMDGEHLCAQYDGEIGNAVPFSVYYGFTRRYSFNPYLKMRTVNALGEQILPLVKRVLAGMSSEWDGNNNVCRMTEDAYAAEAEIHKLIDIAEYNEI